MDPLRNSKDPLLRTAAAAPSARELLRQVASVCHGHSADMTINVALNLVVNVLRQTHGKWGAAEKSFDEYLGRTKQALSDCYTADGRKKGVFPYDQIIRIPPIRLLSKN